MLEVRKIDTNTGKDFIIKYHYSHGVHNRPICWGLFDREELVGVIGFAAPCSENVRSSVFGEEYKSHIIELHRLVLLDEVPKNSESFFISRALKELKKEKPKYWAVLSFADATQGHLGIIYQATNALYTGRSMKATFYLDQTGRLRHPRQNGVNISRKEAKARGWEPVKREGKYRYLFLIPDGKVHKKWMNYHLKLKGLPYPKDVE